MAISAFFNSRQLKKVKASFIRLCLPILTWLWNNLSFLWDIAKLCLSRRVLDAIHANKHFEASNVLSV